MTSLERRVGERRHWLLLLLFSVALSVVIPTLVGGKPALTAVLDARPDYLLLMLLSVFVGWNLKVLRALLLLRGGIGRLGHGRLMMLFLAIAFAAKASPMGSGGPVVAVALLRDHGVRPARAMAVLAVATVFDFAAVLLLMVTFSVIGLARFLTDEPVLQVLLPTLALLVYLAGLWGLVRFERQLLQMLILVMRKLGIAEPRRRKLIRALVAFRRAVRRAVRLPWRGHLLLVSQTLAYWLVYLSVIYFAVQAVGGQMDWLYAAFVQLLGMAGGGLMALPGGAGGAEATAGLLLAPVLAPALIGATLLLWRAVTFYLYLVVGGAALGWLVGWRTIGTLFRFSGVPREDRSSPRG